MFCSIFSVQSRYSMFAENLKKFSATGSESASKSVQKPWLSHVEMGGASRAIAVITLFTHQYGIHVAINLNILVLMYDWHVARLLCTGRWLDEHFENPYASTTEKQRLCLELDMTITQVLSYCQCYECFYSKGSRLSSRVMANIRSVRLSADLDPSL
jgi:hypothetical protein